MCDGAYSLQELSAGLTDQNSSSSYPMLAEVK